MYFNQVKYGTSKYDSANINNKLVGPTINIIPYNDWNIKATTLNIPSFVTALKIGLNTPAAV